MTDNKNQVKELIETIKKMDYRPSWDEYFIITAYHVSKRSSCDRLHVGCVLVQDRRIVSTGYNGHIKGAPHTSKVIDNHEQMTIHAEANAIADAASRGISVQDATLYITHYPCVICAKLLIASGVKKIVHCEDYKNDPLCKDLYDISNVCLTKFIN